MGNWSLRDIICAGGEHSGHTDWLWCQRLLLCPEQMWLLRVEQVRQQGLGRPQCEWTRFGWYLFLHVCLLPVDAAGRITALSQPRVPGGCWSVAAVLGSHYSRGARHRCRSSCLVAAGSAVRAGLLFPFPPSVP